MKTTRHDRPNLSARAANVRAESFDDETNTIDVVWTTGARVVRRPWFGDAFSEELSTEPEAVRLERLNAGAPFLDSHNGGSLRSIIGAVVPGSARMEGGQGVAQVKLSREPEDAAIVNKIKDGIIRAVSVGYEIHARDITEASGDAIALHRATDWEPYEVSAVPMPADPAAHIRSMYEARGVSVDDETKPADLADPITADRSAQTDEAPAASTPNPEEARMITEDDTKASKAEGRAAEKARQAGIRATVRALSLDASAGQALIDDDTGLDAARALLIDAAADKSDDVKTRGGVRVEEGADDNVTAKHAAMTRAILHKADPARNALDEDARDYRGMSMLEMGRESLAMHGVNLRGMGKMSQAREILAFKSGRLNERHAGGAFMSTSDFPLILADVINKTLRMGYDETPRTFTPWARRGTAPDFKAIQRTQLGEAPRLLQVNEHGEFTRGSMGESAETYTLATFGRIVGVTRQVLVNDDLQAFTRIARAFGMAAASLESDAVYAELTDNAVLSDAIALFAAAASPAGHQNIVGAGGVPSIPQYGLMRNLMRQQTGLPVAGVAGPSIDVQMRFIIVPTAAELAAEQVVSMLYQPATAATAVPASMRSLTVIAEPRLDADSTVVYYGAADPSQIDTVEYSYLEGEEGVVTETLNGWDIDGLEVKARLDFAAKAIDYRGLCRNPGA